MPFSTRLPLAGEWATVNKTSPGELTLPPEVPAMPDTYDAYRDALVVEQSTVWPAEYDRLPPAERREIAERLHAGPQDARQIEYLRTHTGFCRKITVTAEDVARLSPKGSKEGGLP